MKLEYQSGAWTPDLRLSKQAAKTTAPGPLPTKYMLSIWKLGPLRFTVYGENMSIYNIDTQKGKLVGFGFW